MAISLARKKPEVVAPGAAARPVLHVHVAPRINLALQQNDVPVLRSLELRNPGDVALGPIRVRVEADPPFLTPYELRIDGVGPHGAHHVEPVPLALSPTFLAHQAERVQGHLTFTVRVEGGDEHVETRPVEVLAPTEWLGLGVLPELLAAFVRPNAPVLAPVLKEAAERLRASTGDAALSGYQSRDPKRVWAVAQALYEAVQARGTSYVEPPASFEYTGQKVRTHEQVLEAGQGTCLDLTVLFAALLEQAGLHPLLLVVHGHAFPGVWLTGFALPQPTLDDPLPIRKRVEIGEALVFDAAAAATGASFEQATQVAERALHDPERFRLAIDVRSARAHRILPLPLERAGDALATAVVASPAVQVTPSPIPDERFRFADDLPAATISPTSRIDRWKQKLLDLSLRNRLLNFRSTKATLALPHVALGSLEDALATGGTFQVVPKLAPRASDPRRAEAGGTLPADVLAAQVREEQDRSVLHSDLPPAEHEKQLLELWRQSRSAFEESGAILLYVTLGMLEWYETPSSTQPRRAPLLLVPVQLERGRAPGAWTLRPAEDDTRVNITLLKKLEVDFGLDVRGLDVLPEDEKGFDVDRVVHAFRRLVRDRDRWQVVDEAHLGLFSFQKFLMWLDLEAKRDALLQNPVVAHLFEGRGEPFPLAAPLVGEAELDRARPAEDVFNVVDADPSQLSAILAAEDGSSFVLQGPPGTGKSQTITNLIAQLLARGRTVLFVSEKLAALEVVQSRLEKVGLAPFCLELHSHQASKQAVMTQLKAAFEVVSRRDHDAWRDHARRLGEARAQLDAHAARLAADTPFGTTTRDVLASLFALTDVPRLVLPHVDTERLTADDVRARRDAAHAFVVAAEDAGTLAGHPYRGVRRDDWTPVWGRAVEDAGRTLAGAARQVEGDRRAVLDAVGLPDDTPLADLVEAARLLLTSPSPPAALVQLGGFRDRTARVAGWVERGRTLLARRTELLARWQEPLLSLDLPGLRQRVQAWASSFFLIAFFMLWGVRRTLGAVARGPLPPHAELATHLDDAAWVRDETAAVEALGDEARALLGPHWQGAGTDWERLGAVVAWAERLHRLLLATLDRTGDPASIARLQRLGTEHAELVAPGSRVHAALEGFLRDVDAYRRAREAARDLLELDEAGAYGDDTPAHVAAVADGWAASTSRLRSWCGLVGATTALERAGLRPVVDAVLDGRVPLADVERTVERSLREGWWEALLDREPSLRSFRGTTHADLVARFRDLDRRALVLARQEVVARLAERAPDLHAPGDEMGLLKRQLMLQRRHMPIRQLFARIPTTLRRLKPCTLMSPLSVAQYLDPTLPGFDVVVFDEASQIPPWDAVGAIARGRQVVVVGDSRQLPPTSFFARSSDDDEGALDEEDVEETESILDEMIAARLRELSLKWHYRSQHESLIAFSNAHYYEDRLHTFPSAAGDVPELGVKLVRVQGFYDRGVTRTNRAEAEAVVEELLRLLRLPDAERPSVGVLTFSRAQQRLVEDLLDAKRRASPELERFFGPSVPEPVFVKNLENVQGDERDVMLFSICYGPDATGKTTIHFGPLNKRGGERRLNVAITRARRRLVVFSTLDWGQIDLDRTTSKGVAHLESFLRYAEQGPGSLASTSVASAAPAEAPFEEEVRRVLTDAGWHVHERVGCSGYRVDLAVVDPERPGTYLLGVVGDGATYHGSRSARERDRLREDVLAGLGWRVHRVWAADWWYDRAGQAERLLAAVEAARTDARVAPIAPSPAPEPPAPPAVAAAGPTLEERLAAAPTVTWPAEASPWEAPELPAVPAAKERFYEAGSRRALAASLAEVVRSAGPVHRDVAYRAVASSWGFASLGKRIVGQLDDAARLIPKAERPVARGDFLWPVDVDPATWRGFRYVREGEARDVDHVAGEEIANTAAWVLSRALSIAEPELVREVVKVFGLRNVTGRVSARVTSALQALEHGGRGIRDGERWRWGA